MKHLLTIPALLAVLVGCGGGEEHVYNEAAHRAAVETHLGHKVGDWPEYLDATRDVCAGTYFDLFSAMSKDNGTYERFLINVMFVCPDRMDEV